MNNVMHPQPQAAHQRRLSPPGLLLIAAMATAGLVIAPAGSAQRPGTEANDAIELAREAKKGRDVERRAAPIPRGSVDVAANGAREWQITFADAMAALQDAARDRGLNIVGPVEIPEGEFVRLRSNRDVARRVWLCGEYEAPNGPCLISMTVHELADKPGRTRASYRVWALAEATSAQVESAIEHADAVLAAIGS